MKPFLAFLLFGLAVVNVTGAMGGYLLLQTMTDPCEAVRKGTQVVVNLVVGFYCLWAAEWNWAKRGN